MTSFQINAGACVDGYSKLVSKALRKHQTKLKKVSVTNALTFYEAASAKKKKVL
jgi:hypothetical protein